MTHTSTKQPSLAAIIRDLRASHARTSPGAWGKGATTHETVSRAEGLAPYKVAEFRHANDAQFCDLAHVFVPRLLSEIEALQSRVNELEAQLSAIGAGGVEPLRKQAAQAAVQAEVPEAIEQMAVERYKVVPSHESMFHRWAVVAGNGTQQLYIGRQVECLNMSRKFTGAFLDGAFLAMQNTAPAHPKVSALSWSHALHDRDAALAAQSKQGEQS